MKLTAHAFSFVTRNFVAETSSLLQDKEGRTCSYVTSAGRPELARIITSAAERADTVGIVVCGPQEMTVEARKAVSELIRRGKGTVKLFVENFGW